MTRQFPNITEGEANCPHCGKPVVFGDSNFVYHVFVEDVEACPGRAARRKWRPVILHG